MERERVSFYVRGRVLLIFGRGAGGRNVVNVSVTEWWSPLVKANVYLNNMSILQFFFGFKNREILIIPSVDRYFQSISIDITKNTP